MVADVIEDSSESSSATSSDDGMDDAPVASNETERLFFQYRRARREWRRHTGKPVRRYRRALRSIVSRRTDCAKAKAVVRNTTADHISRKPVTGRNKTFRCFCSVARDALKAKEKAIPALADEGIRKAKMAKS